MTLLWVVFGALAGFVLLPVVGTLRFMRYVGRHGRRDFSGFTPKLSVIMPCKGIDPGFADNVRSLLEQDYPDYELLFVTATEDDPARALLRDLVERHRERPTRLLVSGIQPGRSQKLNNQLFACERARPDGQALVFVDSDVRARRTFLRELVAPLANRNVGATTGFRWYIPERGGLGSYLRATWNGGGLPMLADPKLAYAWGGAMGILRQTFLRAGVAERWDKALTDDFPVTVAVRNLGLRVEFVPQCLLGSHEDASLSQVLEWTNRQTVICRVYDPALWRAIFAFHAVYVLGFVLAFAGLILSAVAPQAGISAWPFVAMFGVIPIEMGAGMLLWHTVRRILPEIGGWRRALKHALLVPAAMFLIFHNSLHSLATRDICWRGVVYRLHSPTRTEVMGTEAASGATRA